MAAVLSKGQIEWVMGEAIRRHYPPVISILQPVASETVLETAFYKNYNAGHAFINTHYKDSSEVQKLLARKVTPFVLSGIRKSKYQVGDQKVSTQLLSYS